MFRRVLPFLPMLLLLAAPAPAAVGPQKSLDGVQLAQVRIQQWVVVRVTRGTTSTPMPVAPPPSADDVREKHADKCVKTDRVTGAQINRMDAVDLTLDNGKRIRAHLEADCPAVAFYLGFYIKPQKDGKVCAKRDSIRMRSGGQCRITEFRTLVAAK